MADNDNRDTKSQRPIGDPPTRKRPVRANVRTSDNKPDTSMMDPFTEQTTHPAGDGQGANSTSQTGVDQKEDEQVGGDEETMPVEEGFSAIP